MAIKNMTSAVQLFISRQYTATTNFGNELMRYRLKRARNLYRKDLFAHYGCVNAIEFSQDGEWLVSGGDDRRVLLWHVENALSRSGNPHAMKGEHNSNIFCLGFDSKHYRLFSAGNDEQVILHDVETGETVDVFQHDEAVYGLSVDPVNDNVFASACDDGRILIWDIRESNTSDPCMLAGSSSAFHAVTHNPVDSRLIATANSKEGVGLWDVRKPRSCLIQYGGRMSAQSSMSVRFNCRGTCLLALRRRLPPVLYQIDSPYPAVEFDHSGYYNSCTMKSCSFAGDNDQYILSGSDDFKLYMWKIPEDIGDKKGLWVSKAHLHLRGHRSIVNQVRYNKVYSIIASSGVEKIVKLWSVFPLTGGTGNTDEAPFVADDLRKVFTHEEYISLVLESGQFMTHDYSHQSVQEDPRMMAFFDSLVQRDIEGWTTDSSNSSTNTDLMNGCIDLQDEHPLSQSPVLSSSSSLSTSLSLSEASPVNGSPTSERSLSPHTLSYIAALTSRVEADLHNLKEKERLQASKNGEVSEEQANENRISQLIAHKRHEQLLRTARATLKLTTKRLKKSKPDSCAQDNTTTPSSGVSSQETLTLNDSSRILKSVIDSRRLMNENRDRRKILRKRRARILMGVSDSDASSDEAESKQTETMPSSNDNQNSAVSSEIVSDNAAAGSNIDYASGTGDNNFNRQTEENQTTGDDSGISSHTIPECSSTDVSSISSLEGCSVPTSSRSSETSTGNSSNTEHKAFRRFRHKLQLYKKRGADTSDESETEN